MSQTTDRAMSPILLHTDDDVAVVGLDTAAETVLTIAGRELRTVDAIGAGHKVALRAFAPDEPVRKYGEIIGYATAPHRAR